MPLLHLEEKYWSDMDANMQLGKLHPVLPHSPVFGKVGLDKGKGEVEGDAATDQLANCQKKECG